MNNRPWIRKSRPDRNTPRCSTPSPACPLSLLIVSPPPIHPSRICGYVRVRLTIQEYGTGQTVDHFLFPFKVCNLDRKKIRRNLTLNFQAQNCTYEHIYTYTCESNQDNPVGPTTRNSFSNRFDCIHADSQVTLPHLWHCAVLILLLTRSRPPPPPPPSSSHSVNVVLGLLPRNTPVFAFNSCLINCELIHGLLGGVCNIVPVAHKHEYTRLKKQTNKQTYRQTDIQTHKSSSILIYHHKFWSFCA
ncbi:unnamed protein product [Calicophoron daubneyi]|uniref:Uncharacterized protein n=1 Tax=Calicophoron daubneyi TaxID=300641 RepID=A0AAV2TR53_CALDB